MKKILEEIQFKLTEVAGLEYVDENWGQLDDYSPNPPVKWPCCLIDMQGANFSDIGSDRGSMPQRRQEATATIALTVANIKLTGSSGKAPAEHKQAAWYIYDIVERIHEALHGFAPLTNTGSLMRSTLRKVMRDDGIQQFQIVYTIGLHNV